MSRHVQISEALEELDYGGRECNLSWVRGIESDEALMVTGKLSAAGKDVSVNLTRADMAPPVAQIFAQMVLTSPNIVELNLEGNDLDGEVLRVLRGSSGLRTLNLAHNKLGHAGVPYLVELLADNRSLLSLGLENNGLPSEAVVAIACSIQENCGLLELFLSGNMLGDDGVLAVANMLSSSPLQDLYLDGCGIEDSGAEHLAACVASGTSQLRLLNLGNNDIGSNGAMAIAQMLTEASCKLLDLSLLRNPVGLKGVTALAEALVSNSYLRQLDISGIKLTKQELVIVMAAADANHTLELLEIDTCFEAEQAEIDRFTARNQSLASLLPAYRRLALVATLHDRLGAVSPLSKLPR